MASDIGVVDPDLSVFRSLVRMVRRALEGVKGVALVTPSVWFPRDGGAVRREQGCFKQGVQEL